MPDERNGHNVFLSWSGPRSQHVAETLRSWLPMVIQAAKPFMSKKDIEKGSRWHLELAKALEGMKVGIICLTPENLTAPWLLFEAGSLSKTLDRDTRICTYLLAGLEFTDVPLPLGAFQSTKAEQEDTYQMLRDVNRSLGSPISEETLKGVFERMWPDLAAKLSTLPEPGAKIPPKREVKDMVEEILNLTRTVEMRGQSADWIDRYRPMVQSLLGMLESHWPSIQASMAAAQEAKPASTASQETESGLPSRKPEP
jgi:hypothetical protein